jgi:putative ABC transport system permease protein
MRVVTPGFISTMGIPVIAGRSFDARDTARSAPVVLLSDVAARTYLSGGNPIGQRIAFGDQTTWRMVVGVVGSVKHLGLSREAQPEIYVPFSQLSMPFPSVYLVAHFDGEAGLFVRAVKHELSTVNSSLAVGKVQLADDVLAQSKAPERFNIMLIGSFAVLSLLLAAGGIYGVLAFLAVQQTREIGIRMALGAERFGVLRQFLWQSARLALAGIGIGAAGSLALSGFLRSFLFDVSPASPLVYATSSITLFVAAIAAALVPAWRASKVDPIVALREE